MRVLQIFVVPTLHHQGMLGAHGNLHLDNHSILHLHLDDVGSQLFLNRRVLSSCLAVYEHLRDRLGCGIVRYILFHCLLHHYDMLSRFSILLSEI